MSAAAELPEYQVFSILRNGEDVPIGPYSQNEIVTLLNERRLNSNDKVFYEGLSEWAPLGDVFTIHEGIANFEDDGQDREVVGKVFLEISKVSTDHEEVYYVAVQEKTGLRLKGPDAVIVTSFRLCISHQKLTGKREFDMYYWEDIHNTASKITAGEETGTFSVLLRLGERIEVPKIPRRQLLRLAELAREMRATDEVAI
ncbi:MAG: hypothetical protein ACI8UO_006165 [Verrucomicrobiales bacterium]|jgi:hypothetical protein